MKCIARKIGVSALALAASVSTALACGSPPTPPPPPPDPPVVCCVVIDRFLDPLDPTGECLIVRYFRLDGLPLFQSNPMPLPLTQQCACSVPALPTLPGVQSQGLAFGPLLPPWQGLPQDVPGYGPFQPLDPTNDPDQIQFQVDSFFDIYISVALDIDPVQQNAVFSFRGPGEILPNQVFDIYQKIRIPLGFDPNLLCLPGQLGALGLFLVDNGEVLLEPAAPGLPPLPLPAFPGDPGGGAIYKFKWYPVVVPPPCPIIGGNPCPADLDGDGVVGPGDLGQLLGAWGPCP